jgi:hypothetical protein
MSILLPCPACGGEAKQGSSYVGCSNLACALFGPNFDPEGAKWNALPRRTTQKPIADGKTVRVRIPVQRNVSGQLCVWAYCGEDGEWQVQYEDLYAVHCWITADIPLPQPAEAEGVVE